MVAPRNRSRKTVVYGIEMRYAAVALSAVSGLGHILVGRCLRGVVLFFLFGFFLNCLVIAPFVMEGSSGRVMTGALLAMIVVWMFSMWDIVRIVFLRHRSAIRERKRPLFQQALTNYVRGRHDEARAALLKILDLDHDDHDAHFQLGMVLASMGDAAGARRHYSMSLSLDDGQKWRWEVSREVTALRAEEAVTPQGGSGHTA
jgi:hypothetical protein